MFNVVYKRSVLRDLEKLSKEGTLRLFDQLELLDQVEKDLAEKAEAYTELRGQFKGLRRYMFRDFRVVHAIMGEKIVILRIGHTGDKLKRGM